MRIQQFTGSIVGLAVGDALGYPAEFRSRAQLLREIGPNGITDFISLHDPRFSRPFIAGTAQPPGIYTDDTQMSIAVARGLLESPPDDLDGQMQAIARHFVSWAGSPENNRAPGGTCMTGCANLRAGAPWRTAGVPESKGCGSAMRVAPIGLLFADDLDAVERVARASSLLTHGHDAALEGAAAAALLVALALRGASPQAMYDEIMRRCADRSEDFAACLGDLPDMLERPPEEVLIDRHDGGLGEAWVADEAVASALYCVWRHPDDYRAGVLCAVNTDGDSDSIAAITGSILGARLGIEAIPEHWVADVENSGALVDLGTQLWTRRQESAVRA